VVTNIKTKSKDLHIHNDVSVIHHYSPKLSYQYMFVYNPESMLI